MFRKKFDLDEPPALEDGSSYGKMRHKQGRDKDPYNLEERFYRWGIKPDWLQIHRIIAHELVLMTVIMIVCVCEQIFLLQLINTHTLTHLKQQHTNCLSWILLTLSPLSLNLFEQYLSTVSVIHLSLYMLQLICIIR